MRGQVWRFGDCELDEAARELRVRGSPVEIEAKPFDVLRTLLHHAGEVVTKAELLDSVWPGVAVVDGSLATAVSKLRKLLGDERIIVTVTRVGYKLGVAARCHVAAEPASPALHVEAGDRVPGRDQWRLVRRLDPSPAGDVWLAQHLKTREARVFKFAGDEVRLKGLKREVTVARLLREALGERQEFVRILEWNFDAPPYFIESEYAGPNLSEWAEARGGLPSVPWDLRLRLFTDIVRAVAVAHGLDLLHKDLKPANILVTLAEDGIPRVRIADFGSASLLPARLSALGITNQGFTLPAGPDPSALTGTVMYAAPEAYAGQTPTAASDVYALGVLLYQLAAGDFRKPLAPGWERDVADPLIAEDVADAACGDAARRLPSAAVLLERLESLERRRAGRDAVARRVDGTAPAGSRRLRQLWRGAAAVALLALVAAAIALLPRSSAARSVAVLPLQNMRSNPDLDFLRRALADEIATALTHSRGLLVRPSPALDDEQPSTDVKAVGRELQVDTVVDGAYTTQGERLHVTLEAVDVRGEHTIWRDSFDAPVNSLIAAQVQIALRVRGSLARALGSSSPETFREPRNEEAYELYLRSVGLPLVPATNKQTREMLERSVALDPDYPPAWLALGRRYYVESRYAGGDPTMMTRYETAMERALALDPGYVAAGAGLIVSRVERGDLDAAYRRAVDLVERRPDSVDSLFALSYVLRYAGLLDEAADRCEAAFVRDRRMQTSGLRTCAMVFLLRGDYPRTMNYLQVDQGSDFVRALSIDMLARQGRIADALRIGPPDIPGWKSYGLLRACLAGASRGEIDALSDPITPSDDPELNYFAASHLSYCGQTARAVDLLKRAIAGNYCSYPAMDRDPFFAAVRDTAGYADVQAAGRACQARFLEMRGGESRGSRMP